MSFMYIRRIPHYFLPAAPLGGRARAGAGGRADGAICGRFLFRVRYCKPKFNILASFAVFVYFLPLCVREPSGKGVEASRARPAHAILHTSPFAKENVFG
ncbi:hypothetical protein EVAR_51301_1 [Eumeta japonica]|uniref:Uncharacterized protein n=1 Tax=Eumeta variegata TaxID=151549 RepID=A0A4C1XT18_EUMVA|nr:hypothetical protein EVAR_51301_1 [Eumeta japonica]